MDYLDNFTTDKLIDIVQNYEQYKYSVSVKYEAIAILKSRGIKEAEFTTTLSQTKPEFKSKSNNLKPFIIFSVLTIAVYLGLMVFQSLINSYETLAIFGGALLIYIILLVLSFVQHKKFYKLNNLANKPIYLFPFFLFGFLCYPLYFFYVFKKMKNSIQVETR